MRTGAAVLVVVVAAVLGTVTGVVLLPDRGGRTADPASPRTTASPASSSTGSVPPSPNATPPTRSPSGPSATPGDTGNESADDSVSAANLVTAADFSGVGLRVRQRSSNARLEIARCTKGRPTYTTLAEVARSGPPVQRLFEAGHVSASEQAVVLNVAEQSEAADIYQRVLDLAETCQRKTPTYGYLGPTHTDRLGPYTSASWLGSIAGDPEQTGPAPKDVGIDGGVAVLRNNRHVAVLDLGLCASAGESYECTKTDRDPEEILATLSRTAALRLG